MPEVQEVFRMATQKVRPDPGALERQDRRQRRRSMRRKAGVYALVAGLVALAVVSAVQVADQEGRTSPARRPSPSPGTDAAARLGTVTVSSSDCTVDLPEGPIRPGDVLFDVVNESGGVAVVDMLRIRIEDGYTFEQFATRTERDARRAEQGKGPLFAGPAVDLSTRRSTGELEAEGRGLIGGTLQEGTYAIVCLIDYEVLGVRGLHDPIRPVEAVGPISVG
jgi:hypothetical protein